MRQPDDIARFRTEEADGADDVLDVLGIRGGKLPGPGYSPNSSGVTMFTRLSVVCALNTVATSSSKGELKFNAHFGSGISTHNCSYS